MAHIGTILNTWLFGQQVGTDQFGNRYFRHRRGKQAGFHIGRPNTERRWAVYKGTPEPSKVPAEWHAWLHHISDDTPKKNAKKHSWQKPHIPNLTGTNLAYNPPSKDGQRPPATGDYQAWKP